jgi:hypothetical protein
VNIRFFLDRRVQFIGQLYETASMPYAERKRKIEAGEEPFVPPCSEDTDPPFLVDWLEAEESIQLLAYSCVSMLAAALKLYLEEWVRQSRVSIPESMKNSIFKKRGWLAGYKAHFSTRFGITFDAALVDFGLLEEVVLARNRIEHPHLIAANKPQYESDDLKKMRRPFFINDQERVFLAKDDKEEWAWLYPPTLHVTREMLFLAIAEVKRFAEWFESEIESRLYKR